MLTSNLAKVLGAAAIAGATLTASYAAAETFDRTKLPGHVVTIHDDGVTKKSVLKVVEWRGENFLKVAVLMQRSQSAVCEECPGSRKGQPLVGMTLGSGLRYDAGKDRFVDGRILDPENGKTYWLYLEWVNENEIKAKGSLDQGGYVGRSQVWRPCDSACLQRAIAEAPK
ncbi:MAG: DUF2147 domain-containing protein [Myxococcales bacterium]|nr:DUF2147 domain-containing protein [Myxococcales bacterium]